MQAGLKISAQLLQLADQTRSKQKELALEYRKLGNDAAVTVLLIAVLGTIVPLLMNGTLVEHFTKTGGGIVLSGMVISVLGVALCGRAGFMKEKTLAKKEGGPGLQFNMRKGLILTLIAGVLSAV